MASPNSFPLLENDPRGRRRGLLCRPGSGAGDTPSLSGDLGFPDPGVRYRDAGDGTHGCQSPTLAHPTLGKEVPGDLKRKTRRVPAPLLMAKSRHRDLRTLSRYVCPGTKAVARLTAEHDPARRGKHPRR